MKISGSTNSTEQVQQNSVRALITSKMEALYDKTDDLCRQYLRMFGAILGNIGKKWGKVVTVGSKLYPRAVIAVVSHTNDGDLVIQSLVKTTDVEGSLRAFVAYCAHQAFSEHNCKVKLHADTRGLIAIYMGYGFYPDNPQTDLLFDNDTTPLTGTGSGGNMTMDKNVADRYRKIYRSYSSMGQGEILLDESALPPTSQDVEAWSNSLHSQKAKAFIEHMKSFRKKT